VDDMRSNKSHRAVLTLISLLSLAETAAAQAGQTRSDPVDTKVKIVVTVSAPANMPSDELYRAILSSIFQLSLAGTAAARIGQTRSDSVDNGEEKVVVTVSAASETAADQQLSQDFAAAGLRATALLWEWQGRIAYNIRIGLPLCESCVAVDRDQAAAAVRVATVLASKDADRTALQELLNLSGACSGGAMHWLKTTETCS
jgi:hypothetical protein